MTALVLKSKAPAPRHTADQRREALLKAAVTEFAIHGLHGTSTEAIARRTGISQPYIFRLYPTKKALFLAAIERCFDRVEAAFRGALAEPLERNHPEHAGQAGMEPRLHAMGHAYVQLLARREVLLFQMQAYAACSDEEVRKHVRRRWERLMALVIELSGQSREDVTIFFARGMLLNVVASMGMVPAKAPDRWSHETLGFE